MHGEHSSQVFVVQQRGLALQSLAASFTVAILAQGTSWAVAVTQAFLLPAPILVGWRTVHGASRSWNVEYFLEYVVLASRRLLGHDHELCITIVLHRPTQRIPKQHKTCKLSIVY